MFGNTYLFLFPKVGGRGGGETTDNVRSFPLWFLAAPSSSKSLVVCRLVCLSVCLWVDLCEKVTITRVQESDSDSSNCSDSSESSDSRDSSDSDEEENKL